ncbi:hypothetical protein VTL71DRAFT_15798 [Oculimacula yallundae]|uniref:2EXR domain-containing protein n=1 Tax=Oculimacula yallundae TaxID=86028 RepID=A0ABR4CCP2_9HELO
MDEISQTMKEMALELPDPCQHLFTQQLHSFSLFNKLPQEIRLMIWRFLLPKGRRVWLARKKTIRARLQRLKIPIGLWINRECRFETSTYYKAIQHTITPATAADTLVLPDHCMGENNSGRASQLCDLIHENAKALSLVKGIEIKVNPAWISFLYSSEVENQRYVAMALCLSGLNHVTFVCPDGGSRSWLPIYTKWPLILCKAYKRRMERFQQGFKEAGRVIPTLILKDAAGKEWQNLTSDLPEYFPDWVQLAF